MSNSNQSPKSPIPKPIYVAIAVAGAALIGAMGGLVVAPMTSFWTPPPMNSSISVLRPTASVLTAVRDMARLETTTYHIERVVDLRDRQSRLFGLVESEDAILLVAAARVTAGVDLDKLGDSDVVVNQSAGTAKITLPKPEVFHAALDNERTFVHSRSTDLLAKREPQLESEARRAAERTVRDAALEAGILDRACNSAKRTVTTLVRSLGYSSVEVLCES